MGLFYSNYALDGSCQKYEKDDIPREKVLIRCAPEIYFTEPLNYKLNSKL